MGQSVTLKGTKDGYQLVIQSAELTSKIIEDTHNLLEKFEAVPENNTEKISDEVKDEIDNETEEKTLQKIDVEEKKVELENKISLSVKTEQFLLNDEEKFLLTEAIETHTMFEVKSIESTVVTKEFAREWIDNHALQIHTGNIRNGQKIDAPADLLFIGNVQPGGEIRAKRNIFIIGDLKGIAHAGVAGDEKAVIVADFKHEGQIRVADYVQIIEPTSDLAGTFKAALINNQDAFEFQDIKDLDSLRPEITAIMGGELN